MKIGLLILAAHLISEDAGCPSRQEMDEVTEAYDALHLGPGRDITSMGTFPFEALRAAGNSESRILAIGLTPNHYDIYIRCEDASYHITWVVKPEFQEMNNFNYYSMTYVYSIDGSRFLFAAP